MINAEIFLSELIELLQKTFQTRLLYVGLQGSYLRGEATPNSDIDIMVVIDALSVQDLGAYRAIIHSMPYGNKACGFICSREDLSCWNPLEICHLVNSTQDYFGSLQALVPAYTSYDVRNFVKLSVNNLYHEICHSYIYGDQNTTDLICAYKSVFFILQNLYYIQHGRFVPTKNELLTLLEGSNYAVLRRLLDMNNGDEFSLSDNFQLLFSWCQETLHTV